MAIKNNNTCADIIFPFHGINNKILSQLFSDYDVTDRKLKCFGCNKRTKKGIPVAYCCECRHYFHLKCEKLCKSDFPLPRDWFCSMCTMKTLPFNNISDENMKLTNHGFSDESINFVVDKCHSFSIKS